VGKMSIKAYRVNAGYSQEKAAEAIGVATKTLQLWENEQDALKGARLESVKKMCDLYGIEITDIEV